MIKTFSIYEIDDAIDRISFPTVQKWLAGTYWSPGIAQERVEKGARHSALVIGAYLNKAQQVGYARVISDTTRFAYLADVFVDDSQRGKGLARAMVQFALHHPALADIDQWYLRTKDAHAVYRGVGFEPIGHPESWMIYTPPGK